MDSYVRAEKSHKLLCRPDQTSIDYTDGDQLERKLYEALRDTNDCSTFSPELPPLIVDWPSEYHLSRTRHCLLRPLEIKPGDKVLELGCGCGAITRYLGELGSDVTAVEGSMRRALIADERCRDLDNVRIIVDDLANFECDGLFDWVLLVGVLEYASVFSTEINAAQYYVTKAKRFLKRNGRLIVAIENRLGLKYFNGCAEDHVGVPFVGIQDLYKPRGPRTFGRLELEQLLRSAGFRHISFLYPFPDYKLPRLVLTQAALTEPSLDPADLLLGVYARDYARDARYLFDEPAVWRQVVRNGLMEHLSNSFLVVGANSEPTEDRKELAFFYAAQRSAEFATATRILRGTDGIRIVKERLCGDSPQTEHSVEGQRFRHVIGEMEFVPGPLAIREFCDLRAANAGTEEIVTALAPWFGVLVDRSEEMKGKTATATRISALSLPGHFVDATPFNMIKVGDELRPIDFEWHFEGNIPLGWVVARSVFHALVSTPGFEAEPIRIADVILALATRYGLAVSNDEIAQWLAYERAFQGALLQQPVPDAYLSSAVSSRLVSLHQVITDLRTELNSMAGKVVTSIDRDAEPSLARAALATPHRSASWKLTVPLRERKRAFAVLVRRYKVLSFLFRKRGIE